MRGKRILSLVLAALLALGCCGTAFAAEGEEDAAEVLDFLPETRPEPEDDLYGYVNFDTLHEVEIPVGYAAWDGFTENDLRISEALSEIVDECVANAGTYEKGTPEQKIADLYLSYVDEDSRNAVGIEPLQPYFDGIDQAQTVQEYIEALATLCGEVGFASMLSFSPGPDLYDSTHYTVFVGQADLGLGKEYLEDESMSPYWDLYKQFVTELFVLYGLSEEEAAEKTESVFALQTELAASTLAQEDMYDYSKAYIPMSMDDVAALLPTVDMEPVLEKFGVSGVEQTLVVDPGQLEAIGQVLTEDNLPVLKDFSTATLLKDMASYLTMDFRQAALDFSAAMNGVTPKELPEAAKDAVQADLEWDFAKIYVEKFFPEESKQEVLEIVNEILDWFSGRIDELDWMSDETKAAAKKKLDTMTVKIGYPDSYDFVAYLDDVEYVSPADGGSLIENQLNMYRAATAYGLSLVGQEVDKTAWDMTPQTVNAYYNPSANEIVFPAGILRGSFFDPEDSRAAHLGAIGAVIGHELTHAFDSSGANFDENGNLNMWWTEEDFAAFTALQEEIVAFYDNYEVLDGVTVNGNLTLTENIADLGGLHCVSELCGDDPEDLRELFSAWARVWAMKESPEYFDYLIRIDSHSPDAVRANAVASLTDAFYTAFDVQEGDGMYVAPEDRVGIW